MWSNQNIIFLIKAKTKFDGLFDHSITKLTSLQSNAIMKYFLFVVICFFFISNVCAYGEDELKNMMDDVNSNDIGYKKKWTAALRTESRRRPVSKKHSYISSGVSDIQETIIPESPPFRVVVDLPPNRPIRE